MAKKIEVQIVGDASSLHKALGDVTARSKRFGSVLGSSLRVGSIAATAGVVGLGYALKRGIDDFNESQKVAAQTAAVLKSTGGAANVSAKHVNRLAQSLSNMSGVDDEAVGASENLLLTFRNIRNEAGKNNDIFDQATKATLDMSVAMGTDLRSASILVGKALNDPVKGMTALRRVGVSLSDSQQQLIQHLVDTGKSAEAQKIIIGELTKEFGGSAKAAGDTMAGQLDKLKNAFDNAASSVIAGLLPYVVKLAQFALPLATAAIRIVVRDIKHAIHWVADFARQFGILGNKSQSGGQRIRDAFEKVRSFIRSQVFPIIHRLQGIFSDAMVAIGKVVQQHGDELRRIFDRVGGAIKAIAKVAIPILRTGLVKVLPKAIGSAIKALDDITNALSIVVSWLETAYNWVKKLGDAINSIPSLPIDVNKGLGGQLGIDWTKGIVDQPIFGGGGGDGGKKGKDHAIQANLYLDGKVFYSAMVNQDKVSRRQTGRSLLA